MVASLSDYWSISMHMICWRRKGIAATLLLVLASLAAFAWAAATGEPLIPPLRHEDDVLGAAFSADGHRVLT